LLHRISILFSLKKLPLWVNGEAVDIAGYVITYQAELPDSDAHFHNFEVLASSSTYIHIATQERPHTDAHDHDDHDGHDDDCDDDDDHGHSHGHSH
jgi:hypothetical protein